MPPRRPARPIQLALQLLGAAAKVAHNVADVGDAVKVELELVDLAHDVVVARNLGVGVVDQVAGAVVHGHRHHLRLLRQVLELLLDVLHDAVKVAAQRGQRRGVEHQEPLGRGAAGGARRRRARGGGGLLVLAEELYLFAGEAQLRVWHGGRRVLGGHGGRGASASGDGRWAVGSNASVGRVESQTVVSGGFLGPRWTQRAAAVSRRGTTREAEEVRCGLAILSSVVSAGAVKRYGCGSGKVAAAG